MKGRSGPGLTVQEGWYKAWTLFLDKTEKRSRERDFASLNPANGISLRSTGMNSMLQDSQDGMWLKIILFILLILAILSKTEDAKG